MDQREYHEECRKAALRIDNQIVAGELPHQPGTEEYEDPTDLKMKKRGTNVWVMSVQNPHKNTTAGTISAVPIKQAGQLVFDVTHRLATAAEITAHNAEMKRRLEQQKADIVKQQKLRGQGADPDLIEALKGVVQAAVNKRN